MRAWKAILFAVLLSAGWGIGSATASPDSWRYEWPRTDFSRHSVDYGGILSGGPPKDGIPAIDNPSFKPVSAVEGLADTEPVIGLVVGDDARAYPLSVLMWHEIANDTVGGVPVAITFCPLCNAAIVFDRRVEGRVLDFGTTGKLRNSDLVMYDRQTESWWQQFLGEGIVGEMTGKRLKILPARIESFARFRQRAPAGKVLIPNRPSVRYGGNPYVGYDSLDRPFLFRGDLPEGIAPLARVVSVSEKEAWSLDLLRKKGTIRSGDIVITWEKGQNSALDSAVIAEGADVGNVIVQRKENGEWVDVPYGIDFAFAFHAFRPKAVIHVN